MDAGSTIRRLAAAVLGEERADTALAALRVPEAVAGAAGDVVDRAQLATALTVVLFADLLDRVPTAAAYVRGVTLRGDAVVFDHGALRTIEGDTGALPSGHHAFARLLEPLGYTVGGVYPLPRLTMTGRAYVHADLPEDVPQFFVSELHVAELPQPAREAAARVFGASADPLGAVERALLDRMGGEGRADLDTALAGFPGLVAAFGCHHPDPTLADYETLLAHTAEGAWIATEGNAFNHATDRVPDVEALAAALKVDGVPMKERVEISTNGRVRQTALVADTVERRFALPDGATTTRTVPGSFYEFISRDVDPATGALDLTFDSGNATGIFAMTHAS